MARPVTPKATRERVRHFLRLGYSESIVIKSLKKEGITISRIVIQKVRNGDYETKDPVETPKRIKRTLKVLTEAKLNNLRNDVQAKDPPTQRYLAKKYKVSQPTIDYHIHKTFKLKTRKAKRTFTDRTTNRNLEVKKHQVI